ncbi:MAG: hypothetical protein HOD37_08765 [Bacteroidetes bacterium]|nr:hypothetical protein [Bacteroidota bacterium]
MMKTTVPNKSLKLSEIPLLESRYENIEQFALTFDGYELSNCAELANSRSAKTLSEMRAVLFFEQRRFRHFGYYPEGEDLEYIRMLVRKIKSAVQLKDVY